MEMIAAILCLTLNEEPHLAKELFGLHPVPKTPS